MTMTMTRKMMTYPKWAEIKDIRKSTEISRCSVAALYISIPKYRIMRDRMLPQVEFFVMGLEPIGGYMVASNRNKSFYFNENEYYKAIVYYEKLINDYLDSVEQEYYTKGE